MSCPYCAMPILLNRERAEKAYAELDEPVALPVPAVVYRGCEHWERPDAEPSL